MYQQILQVLHDSALIAEPKITELRVYGEERFRVKIRGNVTESLTLQIWINHNSLRTRYSYQLFGEERPIFRRDNAPPIYDLLSSWWPNAGGGPCGFVCGSCELLIQWTADYHSPSCESVGIDHRGAHILVP